MISMSLVVRAILAIVGGWLIWLQLGQLVTMINTHSMNVLSVILLVVGILLLLYAIKPNFLRTKKWWQIWKQVPYSSQNSAGHNSSSLETTPSKPAASKRFRIISSTSEILTLKISARISLAVWSSKAFGLQCTTTLFCGLISCSRTPAIVCLSYV